MTDQSIISAGFGGQGIMLLGKVLAAAGMESGFYVTMMPSYGAEVRGGTAHSTVCISSDTVANPVVKKADTAILLNDPSRERFEKIVKPGGLIILNTSMAKGEVKRDDVELIAVALTDEALKLGNVRVANMIAAGIFIEKKKFINKDTLIKVFHIMAKGRQALIDVNVRAVDRGIELAG